MVLYTIITPTTGNPKLQKVLESINNQSLLDDIQIEHFIVVDGPKFDNVVKEILETIKPIHPRYLFNLPFNTGGDGYVGHKIYAAISQLVHGDYVIMLDEDNYLDIEHILSFHQKIKSRDKTDWLYCLRKIINDDGYVCDDNCESLGYLSHVFYNPNDRLIDTNCYCISRNVMIKQSHIWNRKVTSDYLNPDRVFAKILMTHYLNYECTGKYTLYYYTGNRETSVRADLFLKGNEIIKKAFRRFPWCEKPLFLVHFNKEQTLRVLNRVYGNQGARPLPSEAFKQWNINIYDDLADRALLLNGYDEYIPSGSRVLFVICHVQELPKNLLERTDIEKIVYTLEGPNIRHQQQWGLEFLLKYFTKIITYWRPLIQISPQLENRITYFPFIHRFDLNNPNDLECIKENNNIGKQVCIILEKRDIAGDYNINGVDFKALDYLRWEYSSNLGKRIDCYGQTWKPFSDKINYREAENRFLDQERVIDIMEKYTFALIIENCNGDGYVSEKIYDALTVGCIPLYYGNNNAQLGIPEDCYIDLKQISPVDLPKLLDSMDTQFIEIFRQNIYKKRLEILKRVSVNAFSMKLSMI